MASTTTTLLKKGLSPKSLSSSTKDLLCILPNELLLEILTNLDTSSIFSVAQVNRTLRGILRAHHEFIRVSALYNTEITTSFANSFSNLSPNVPAAVLQYPPYIQSLRHVFKVEQLAKATTELALKLDILDHKVFQEEYPFITNEPYAIIDYLGLEFEVMFFPELSEGTAFQDFQDWLCEESFEIADEYYHNPPPQKPAAKMKQTLAYFASINYYYPQKTVHELENFVTSRKRSENHWVSLKARVDRLLLQYIDREVYQVDGITPLWHGDDELEKRFNIFFRHSETHWLLNVLQYDGTNEYSNCVDRVDAIWEKVEEVWYNYGELYDLEKLPW